MYGENFRFTCAYVNLHFIDVRLKNCTTNSILTPWRLILVARRKQQILKMNLNTTTLRVCQNYFNTCTVHLWLVYTLTIKCTINWKIITVLLHVSTQLFHRPWGWHSCVETCRKNKMRYFLFIYFNNNPLYVSSRLAAHHQDDQLFKNSNCYSQHNAWLGQLLFIHSWSSWWWAASLFEICRVLLLK